MYTLECCRGPFFLKQLKGNQARCLLPLYFHSSPKNMPKVKSRGLDHSAKDFFMWFFMWFCKILCQNLVMFKYAG